MLPDFKLLMLAIIIYRPLDQSSFIDDFNVAFNELTPRRSETYFTGDFSINLFFEGHVVLNKTYTKFKEAQSKTTKTLLRDMLSFGSNSTDK